MTYHVCDLPECGKKSETPLWYHVKFTGPAEDDSEKARNRSFCSRACFIRWMRGELHAENGTTSVLAAVKAPQRHPY